MVSNHRELEVQEEQQRWRSAAGGSPVQSS